jgi:hypothetical protein
MPEGEARNVLERFAKLGVSLNGLVIPGRSIESVLARHALTLVVNNEGDKTFKLSLPGSATAIRYRGHDLHAYHAAPAERASMKVKWQC